MKRYQKNTLVSFFALILITGGFQNCGSSFEAKNANVHIPSLADFDDGGDGGDGGGGNNPPPDIHAEGKALYEQNCTTCHGSIADSNKKERSPFQIATAINTLSYMSHLQFLSADQIEKIALSLNYNPNQGPGQCKGTRTADFNAVFRMNKDEYNNTVKDLFGSPSSVTDSFPPDNDGEAYANDAALLAKASEAQIEQYFHAAEKVVEDIWDRDKSMIMTCNPSSTVPSTCARNIIEHWGRLVFRRPITTEERDQLLSFVNTQSGVQASVFEKGIQTALKSMLFSPNFIYRTISSSTGSTSNLDGYELATRLSYFIWSSTPDAELLNKASTGALMQPSEIKAQVIRMLGDARSQRLTKNFAKRWMGLNRLAQVVPDPSVYPNYTASLKTSFEKETELLFQNIFEQNASFDEVLNANYSYINGQLASHYGISGVSGSQFRKVSLNGTSRRGVASHGSVLMLTSHTDDSSVINRGKWLLEKLMCDPPPPPPANIPGLPDTGSTSGLTKRQALEAHRNNPSCFSCHAKMEPLGFGLENFDAIGGWRTSLNGKPVDNAGALPNGQPYNSTAQLAQYLTENETFYQCAAKNLVTYAIGRRLEDQDDCNVRDIAKSIDPGKSIADTITAIVTNDLFKKVRGK